MKAQQKTEFYTQLATMSRGGLPLSQGFKVLEENLPSPVVAAIRQSIEDGKSLDLAFQRPEFSPFERSFIAAGNQTGQLAVSFSALADYWQREVDLLKAVRQAMIYPLVMLHLTVLIGPIALLLSDPKAYLLAVLQTFGFLYLAGFGLYWLIRFLWSRSSTRSLLLRTPLFGAFWKNVYLLRWIQITRMEFLSGIGLPQAVADAWQATQAAEATALAQEAEAELLAGGNLSELWQRWRMFPGEWKGYLVAAETSGQLGTTLGFLLEESEKKYLRSRRALEEWVPKIFYALILIIVGILFVKSQIDSTHGIMEQINQMGN